MISPAPRPSRQARLLHALGLTPAEVEAFTQAESHGYWFWGPIALVIGLVEILGAVSDSVENWIPWPTISATVGHLESRWDWVKVIVVGLIAAIVFDAVSSRLDKTEFGKQAENESPFVPLYDAVVVVVVLAGGGIAYALGATKYQLGYTIYGLLATVGIIIPSVLAHWFNSVLRFPSLFKTIAFLRLRFRAAASVLVAGLSILTFHLALYPWP